MIKIVDFMLCIFYYGFLNFKFYGWNEYVYSLCILP